jgi:hypothetical protein
MLHCRQLRILQEEGTAGSVECQFQVYEAATTVGFQMIRESERKELLAAFLRSAANGQHQQTPVHLSLLALSVSIVAFT